MVRSLQHRGNRGSCRGYNFEVSCLSCGVPWLFVNCSEFFHLIWGVRYSFHLQCAVDFFYSGCSVSLCCVGVHLIFIGGAGLILFVVNWI